MVRASRIQLEGKVELNQKWPPEIMIIKHYRENKLDCIQRGSIYWHQ